MNPNTDSLIRLRFKFDLSFHDGQFYCAHDVSRCFVGDLLGVGVQVATTSTLCDFLAVFHFAAQLNGAKFQLEHTHTHKKQFTNKKTVHCVHTKYSKKLTLVFFQKTMVGPVCQQPLWTCIFGWQEIFTSQFVAGNLHLIEVASRYILKVYLGTSRLSCLTDPPVFLPVCHGKNHRSTF